jgi:hypothetical protein
MIKYGKTAVSGPSFHGQMQENNNKKIVSKYAVLMIPDSITALSSPGQQTTAFDVNATPSLLQPLNVHPFVRNDCSLCC